MGTKATTFLGDVSYFLFRIRLPTEDCRMKQERGSARYFETARGYF